LLPQHRNGELFGFFSSFYGAFDFKDFLKVTKANIQQTTSFRDIDDRQRDELIRSYLPLVKRVVHRLASRLPSEVDLKEMLNSGIIGLVDALEKFDPKHETNFSTYAQFRIRGAILDSFRAQDWAPRSLRHKTHKLEKAYLKLEQTLGRPAEEEEVATWFRSWRGSFSR